MTTSTGEDVGKGKDLFPIGGSENSCSHYRSQYGDSSKELVTELLCISAIPLGGDIYPKVWISYSRETAVFTISRKLKQSRCQSTDEQIIKTWYINTMEFYTCVQKNEICR